MDENDKTWDSLNSAIKSSTIAMPKSPEWYFSLDPTFKIRFGTFNPPNRFHRWMQKHLLGIYWKEFKGGT